MELHLPEIIPALRAGGENGGFLTPEEAKIWPGGWESGVGGKIPV